MPSNPRNRCASHPRVFGTVIPTMRAVAACVFRKWARNTDHKRETLPGPLHRRVSKTQKLIT